jgi:hypothetical protein
LKMVVLLVSSLKLSIQISMTSLIAVADNLRL